MSSRPHFGILLPQIGSSWQAARSAALDAERLGFDSVWVCDHLRGLPDITSSIFEAWTMLSGVAALTERVELGTLVTPPFFRNAAVLAKQVATLSHISGGRVVPGLGAGWLQEEFDAYGCEFPALPERLRALEETCELLKRLWTEPEVSFSGAHYRAKGAVCEPKPVRPPPLLVGGSGERVLMRIAARYADIWNNPFQQQLLAQKIAALRKHCDEQRRDFASITVSQTCLVLITEHDRGLPELLRQTGGEAEPGFEEHGIWGTPARVVERIGRHLELGCDHFVFQFPGPPEAVTLFAEQVMPAFA